jgi:hypothetical protein|tara:strand:+ start:247 stop:672 length:426 start_codon:yes stop_codon:yes gene_type:complete
MIFFRNLFFNLLVVLLMTMSSQLLADDNKSKEEPLPLNDPFVGDSSFSGGVKVISDGTSTEQKRIDLFDYKLVGIIRSNQTSFISLINQDGENITLEMNETLNDGVKLVDMNQKEAIFLVEESDSYLIMNFKNEIKETSEY